MFVRFEIWSEASYFLLLYPKEKDMKYIVLLIAMTLFCTSCTGQQKTETKVNPEQQEKKRVFQLPEVPVMLQQAEERLNYVVQHYWENFDFKDTAYIHVPEVTEQAVVNYLDLLMRVPMEMADTCLAETVRQSGQEKKMEEYLTGVFRRYLMDPNSPLRYEELYEPVARVLSGHSDLVVSTKAKRDLKLINLNRRGTIANDFVYTLYGGAQKRMHRLEADYLILLFYNPDCETCAQVVKELKGSECLNVWLAEKKVKLLAVYPDEEYNLWENYRGNLPSSWINAYDKEHKVLYEELYDLKAMPTIYLLDKQKKVLLKDVYWSQVENYLKNNSL